MAQLSLPYLFLEILKANQSKTNKQTNQQKKSTLPTKKTQPKTSKQEKPDKLKTPNRNILTFVPHHIELICCRIHAWSNTLAFNVLHQAWIQPLVFKTIFPLVWKQKHHMVSPWLDIHSWACCCSFQILLVEKVKACRAASVNAKLPQQEVREKYVGSCMHLSLLLMLQELYITQTGLFTLRGAEPWGESEQSSSLELLFSCSCRSFCEAFLLESAPERSSAWKSPHISAIKNVWGMMISKRVAGRQTSEVLLS